MEPLSYYLPNEEASIELGYQLAHTLTPGMIIHLSGNLGTGKTTLVRAMLRQLGVTGSIKSPTYSVVEVYVISNYIVYHIDFYRFLRENEWESFGMRDMMDKDAILLIEWPEMAGDSLANPDLSIALTFADTGRYIAISTHTDKGRQQLVQLNYVEKMD